MMTPNPTSLPADRLRPFFHQLSALHADLSCCRLDAIQRKKLGGLLCPIGPGLVAGLTVEMAHRKDLFPDAPGPGQAMGERAW